MSEPVPQSRDRSLFYLSLAALIAGITALGTWRVVSSYQAELTEARRPRDTLEVLVAARDLGPGEVLEEDDVTLTRLPTDAVPAASAFTTKEAVIGETVIERVLTGEPVRTERLTTGNGMVLPETLLESGTRAVTVRMDRAAGVGGMLTPGSYVDVVVTIRPDTNTMGANYVTETILQAVRVLAVGNATVATSAEKKSDKERKAPNTPREVFATLEVEPDEVEKIAMATARGELYLSLRARNDFELLEQKVPLITNTLVGISAEPSPARTSRIARRRAAVAAATPVAETTPPQEVIQGSKSTLVTFDEAGRVETARKK